MSELEFRAMLRTMPKRELMIGLAYQLLLEKGIKFTDPKQLEEVIEENFMKEVAMEDLRLEIMNSRHRLGWDQHG